TLHHHHDDVARALKWSVGGKPRVQLKFSSLPALGRAGLAANAHSRNEGRFAAAFRVFDVAQHRVAHDFEAARLDAQLAANLGRGHEGWLFTAERVLRFNAFDQARAKHFSAVSDGRCHDSHLQRRDVDRSLPNGKVRGIAVGPTPPPGPRRWKRTARFVAGLELRLLAQMQLLVAANDAFRSVN